MSREEGFIFSTPDCFNEINMYFLTHAPDYPERLFWSAKKEDAVIFTRLDEDIRDFLKDFNYYKSPAIAYREVVVTGNYEKFDRINNGQ